MAKNEVFDGVAKLHVDITLTLTHGESYWKDPRAVQSLNFYIPVYLFDGKRIGDVIQDMLKVLPAQLELAEKEFELEQKKNELTEGG